MYRCNECGIQIYTNNYICTSSFQNFIHAINTIITPSNAKNLTVETVFPQYMTENMSDFLVKDIKEILQCLAHQLWNATVLMSSRIFEVQLKTHICTDLQIDCDFQGIGQCIKTLQQIGYPPQLIQYFDDLRKVRNTAMHGDKRYSPQEAIEISKKVISIVAWIYNIAISN